MQFTTISKFSFVLFVAVLLASVAYGKPYKVEQLSDDKDQSFIEANRKLNLDVNETSSFRGKRDASSQEEYLKYYCGQRPTPSSPMGRTCKAGSYSCHNYVEVECYPLSWDCLPSIATVGTAKCVPGYEWVTIDLGSKGKRRVRRTKECKCA